jgi:hypothetical protein
MVAVQAAAQAPDVAGAEALFREGKRLLEQGDYPAACPKLAESLRLDPATGTLLALAMCHESEGKTATAWAEYADVASRAKQEGRLDREQAARAKVAELEPKLSTLAIVPSPQAAAIAGLIVKRDGAVVGPAAWQTPVPIDPGEHRFEASAPGKVGWSASVVVGPNGDKKVVEIPNLADEVATAPGIAAPATGEAGRPGLAGMQKAGIAVAVVGVAGLVVGVIYGLRAMGKNDDSKADCTGNACGEMGKALRLDAIEAGNISTIGFVAGGVLAAGGAAMYVLGRPKETAGAAVHVAPTASASGLGVIVGGRF